MAIYRACLTFLNSFNRQNLTIIRCVRNPTRRGGGPKLLEGTVKSNDEMEGGNEFSRISSYEDIMKIAGPKEELLVEKAFSSENDLGAALGEKNTADLKFNDDDRFIKKKIIEWKHFKNNVKESNLLTHAAKEQIRHLHQLDPDEWNVVALSEHFPITVKGVKKLLKNNFVLKDPDAIKQHDAEVEEKWRALESRQPSKLIYPRTRQLWNEGKLNKHNYRSNPSLPSAPPEEGKTIILKKPAIGEYSAIVQQYINYKTKTEAKVKPSDGKEVLLYEEVKNKSKDKRFNKFKFSDYRYSTENEDRNPSYEKNSKKIKSFDDVDIVHSQYTANMKEVKSVKEITSNPQYAEWLDKQAKQREPQTVKKSSNTEVFTVISKFKETDDFKYNPIMTENVPKKKPSFQSRRDKTQHRGSPPVSSKNKNNLYREGQNVYNEHGQFLYKVPI